MMNKEAKLKYKAGSFDVIVEGDYVLCSVSKKQIALQDLKYWNGITRSLLFPRGSGKKTIP